MVAYGINRFSHNVAHLICDLFPLQIEQSLDIVTKLVSDCKAALEQVISGSEKEKTEKTEKTEKSKKGHVGDVLGKTLKNVSFFFFFTKKILPHCQHLS